jgi:hypothetical protein
VGRAGFFGFLRERERNRRYKGGKEKPSSLAFASPVEEDDKQCHRNDIVCSFFFPMKNE